jgi:hypothetical protein
MKNKLLQFIFSFIIFPALLLPEQIYAQATIQSLIPSSGFKGQQLDLVIRGNNTHFSNGVTQILIDGGIVVNAISVQSNVVIMASVTIGTGVGVGLKTVQVNTGTERIMLTEGFEVIATGTTVQAILEINPVQIVYASDFDPDFPALNPKLFHISVINDQQVRTLKVIFTLFHETYGKLGSAKKLLTNIASRAIVQFDNRQFDSYTFKPESNTLAKEVLATGILPPGTYRYLVEVVDVHDVLIVTEEVTTIITNQATDLLLFAPGNATDFTPEVIQPGQPLFQWISTAPRFELLLFKVTTGNTSAQAILQSMPIYRSERLSGTTFLYPLSAEQLEAGAVYAWQVRAFIAGGKGELVIESPLFWFTLAQPGTNQSAITALKVEPATRDVSVNTKLQLRAVALDAAGNPRTVIPVWKVIPALDGNVNASGLFTAGNRPKTVAVVAEYGGFRDYAVVNINWSADAAFNFEILHQLFGVTKKTNKK